LMRVTAAKKSSAPWVAAINPPPDWTAEMTGRESGWELAARWWGYAEDRPSRKGPREVVIRAAEDISPEALRRGVTSGVMRRLENLLGELVNEFAGTVEGWSCDDDSVRAAWEQGARALSRVGPRSAPESYYQTLLDLFEIIELRSSQPVNELARVMQVPKETLKTRLRVARQRRARLVHATPGLPDDRRAFGIAGDTDAGTRG
jgi:hypothetical protein